MYKRQLLGLLAAACSREQEVRRYEEVTFQAAPKNAPNAPMAGGKGMLGGKVPQAGLRPAGETPGGRAGGGGGAPRFITHLRSPRAH